VAHGGRATFNLLSFVVGIFDWSIIKNNSKNQSINQSLDSPKINTFASFFSFGLAHIIYKSRELGQRLGDNVSSCWEQVEELIGNLGTCLVFNENNKYPTPPPSPQKKEKNLGGLMCACCITSLAARNFLFGICVFGHFWSSLMAGA